MSKKFFLTHMQYQKSEMRGDFERSFFKRLRALVLLLAAVLAIPAAAAQVEAQKPAEPANAPALQAAQTIVAKQAALVSEFDVNGLKVLVKKREGSLTVAAGLFIRGGSENITDKDAGIQALMLDVASDASTAYPREKMRSELARLGTVITSSDNYDYSALSLISTRVNFDRSWDIFTDVILRPSFTKEDFDLEKNRRLSSLRDDSDDPDTYLQRLQERVAYAGHPYLNRPEGTLESVTRLTAEDLRAYHRRMLETSRLLLVIVGDLDAAQLKPRIAAAFGKLPKGNYHNETPPSLSFPASTVEVTERSLPTNYIQGIFTAPSLTAPDIYPMMVASSLLRDRVFQEVRVKRNLSYAPSAFLGTQAANVGGIYVTAVDANQAVSVMLSEINRLQTQAADQYDINGVVSQYLTTYYMGQETNAAQAGNLAAYELIGGGWRNSFDMIARLHSVTPADVQRVAQKYMHNLRFVVLGNPKSVDTKIFTGQAGN
ncbi:MAG TPA: pitrilysin family protein [Pyrinomonadaceae bacterium]|nr:pitrilysin family protein [Pyrinomonadaceae bacterium]